MRRLLSIFVLATLTVPALAEEPVAGAAAEGGLKDSHAIAMHGALKYKAGFAHFDYANPNAPKGGVLRLAGDQTFDSLNGYIVKGTAADGLGLIHATLMVSSSDEPFSMYAYLAKAIETPKDRSWVVFTLNEKARFSDGKPVTPEDVAFSLNILKTKGHPQYRYYYKDIVKAEVLPGNKVKFTFRKGENRELPLISAQIPILPKHYWAGKEFDRVSLDIPVGAGPYKIKDVNPGRSITYERVKGWWGENVPSQKGHNNFDVIHYQYFRDATVQREALKAGEFDWRRENQAKAWARDYDSPAREAGELILRKFPNSRNQGMQAFIMNGRKGIFKDWRVRRALVYAFNFEWTNRYLFFGQYKRTRSYFANSDLASSGLPKGRELEILAQYRNQLPKDLFTKPYSLPAYKTPRDFRAGLRRAFALLKEAGWEVRDMKLVNVKTGKQMRFEIMIYSPAFVRIMLPYVENLKRLGIAPRVRLVDISQYINRIRKYDFDMFAGGWGQSESPGNEQRLYWSSRVIKVPGARNFAAINSPVVDKLIEYLIAAPDRKELVYRTRALDRVLLWGHHVVPNWHLASDRWVYWDKFGIPKTIPKYGPTIMVWWIDPEKAKRLKDKLRSEQTAAANDGKTER